MVRVINHHLIGLTLMIISSHGPITKITFHTGIYAAESGCGFGKCESGTYLSSYLNNMSNYF